MSAGKNPRLPLMGISTVISASQVSTQPNRADKRVAPASIQPETRTDSSQKEGRNEENLFTFFNFFCEKKQDVFTSAALGDQASIKFKVYLKRD